MKKLPTKTLIPSALLRNGPAALVDLDNQIIANKIILKFRTSLYGGKSVRSSLDKLHFGNCAYCEASLRPVMTGHVEHFRPKGGYIDGNTGNIVKPGYYKLAYSWENLLLSCQICNGTHKKNFFPLTTEANRTTDPNEIAKEDCLLINPFETDPTDHIKFRSNIPFALKSSVRGKATISVIGLDREDLNDARKKTLRLVKLAYTVTQKFPVSSQEYKDGKAAYDILTASSYNFILVFRIT